MKSSKSNTSIIGWTTSKDIDLLDLWLGGPPPEFRHRYILSFMDQEDIKSIRLEEVDIPQNLDLLNKWTILRVNIKTIYDYGWFDKISNKLLIKTTEQSLALNSSEQTICLLNKRDIEFYKSQYKFLHIGMVQIAFKPLTLKGLP
ncbi:hypothetical protein H5410_037006 [Solanum commersonii]|uniref:Uncharacterized protein n=1 Tax=Solanum commersonii TaxID=4109 RepID=A0A9J5Y9X6_SOLCO|nr:hypothetical protein H5410_037006 [Solanum commersonii]